MPRAFASEDDKSSLQYRKFMDVQINTYITILLRDTRSFVCGQHKYTCNQWYPKLD